MGVFVGTRRGDEIDKRGLFIYVVIKITLGAYFIKQM
jgi:hypothetical protein